MNTADIRPFSAKPARVASLIWNIAELLRGDVRPADYGSFILPFTVLRRLDCVLEKTKPAVLAVVKKISDLEHLRLDQRLALERAAGPKIKFYNASAQTLTTALNDPNNLRANLEEYIGAFSPNIRDVFERYKTAARIVELDEKNLLYNVLKEFVAVDLHPDVVPPSEMGDAFENLIRRFAELSNETAGEHYTPRDAIRLAVDLLLTGDNDLLENEAPLRSVYDPTAGTGGFLSAAEDHIKAYNKHATVTAYAQELNDESYAVCKADMLIKGQDVNNVVQGNTLSDDKFPDKKFDWMLSNPPYGVDWKKIQDKIEKEHSTKGSRGRFGPGLPRVSDGQLLFLLHLVSKMQPLETSGTGSRIAIVTNGSALFSGGVGTGESEIRKYLFNNDLVEGIVSLPTEMFYNTSIATYIWVLTNNKTEERKGKVQLVDGSTFWNKMPKNLGSKRRSMSNDDIASVVKLYGDFENCQFSKILHNEALGYQTIIVERPLRLSYKITNANLTKLDKEKTLRRNGIDLANLRDVIATDMQEKSFISRSSFQIALSIVLKKRGLALTTSQMRTVCQVFSERDDDADICVDANGRPEPDPELRDTENIALGEDIDSFFEKEVKPFAPGAWIDYDKTRIGYEALFSRYFYKYTPPRTLKDIDSELQTLTSEIIELLGETLS